MKRRYLAALVLPVLLLAGCSAASQTPSSAPPAAAGATTPPSAAPSTAPVSTPTAAPPVAATPTPAPTKKKKAGPVYVNAANYLVSGKPHHPDSNGEWYGRWAFYTSSQKYVLCDIFVFSGDPAAVHCYLTGHAVMSHINWSAPAAISSTCGSQGSYSVGLNIESLYPKEAGFMGCDPYIDAVSASIQAKTKVLPDKAILAVSPFSCTTTSGAATCRSTSSMGGGGALSFGIHSLAFQQ